MTEIQEEIRVRATREKVYEMWRDPDTFVQIVGSLEDAERDGDTLRWQASGPFGLTIQGEAEITQEHKPEKIAWNTIEGALDAHGSIEFTADGDETLVRYRLEYEVPGGPAGQVVANVADPREHVKTTLARFRELAEAPR